MKNLGQFLNFDCAAFFTGKKLMVTNCSPWNGNDGKEHLGTKVEVVILEDKTTYKPNKDGSVSKNLYAIIAVKVGKDISVPEGAVVEIVNPVGTVWGDYHNQLSIRADDVKVIPQK